MKTLNQQKGIHKPGKSNIFTKKSAILSTAILMALSTSAYSSNNTTNNGSQDEIESGITLNTLNGYLDSLKNLDQNIEYKDFVIEWKKIEDNLPKDLSDSELEAIFYGLYDIKSNFTDQKIIKKINKLMEIYNPLYSKYAGFDDVRDAISIPLQNNKDILKEEFELIDIFFDGFGEEEALWRDNEDTKFVHWSNLIIDELKDDEGGEKKIAKNSFKRNTKGNKGMKYYRKTIKGL